MATGLAPGSGLPDVNKAPQIIGAVVTTTALALVIVALRLYVRIYMLRSASYDDCFIIIGMVCSLASFGVNISDISYGAGRHAVYIFPPSSITTGLKLNFVTQPLLLSGVTFVKVSIGFFLLRIAPDSRWRRSIIGANVFLLVMTTFFVITLFVQCRPLAAVWDFSLRPTAKCWDSKVLRKMSYVNSSLNVVTDIGFAILPWPILWNIQLRKRSKAALLGVLSLGLFACIASIIKLTYISSYGRSGDFLFDSAELTIWTTTEVNVGAIAGSIPCLKPLFKIFLEKSGIRSSNKTPRAPAGLRRFSYVRQREDGRSSDEYGSLSRTERGDNGESLQTVDTVGGIELTKPKSAQVHVTRVE